MTVLEHILTLNQDYTCHFSDIATQTVIDTTETCYWHPNLMNGEDEVQ